MHISVSKEFSMRWIPLIAVFCVALSWGWSFSYVKGVLDVIPPLVFVGWSFLLSGLFFFVVAVFRGEPLLFRWREGLVLGFFLFLLEGLQKIGLSGTSAGNTAFISEIGILVIPIMEWLFFKKFLRRAHVFALILAFFGLYELTGGIHHLTSGDLFVLACAFACAAYIMITDRYEKESASNIITLCAQQFLFVAAISFSCASVLDVPIVIHDTHAITQLVFLTIITMLFPYFLVQWAQRYVNDMRAAFTYSLEPVFGGAFAWTIGGEQATPWMLVGAVCMFSAMIIVQYQNVHGRRRTDPSDIVAGVAHRSITRAS